MTFGKDVTIYSCGHVTESDPRFGIDKKLNISYPCLECRTEMIGKRINVVRFGDIPSCGKSYNYRDNKYEIGISCYLIGMNYRPEFTENRNILLFSAICVGFGGDCEPLIDPNTIKY